MERQCDLCGTTYTAVRSTSRWCRPACRTAAGKRGLSKRRGGGASVTPVRAAAVGNVLDATRAELEAAGRVESAAGQRALVLAGLLDSPPMGSYGSLAGWSKEHSASLAEALKDAGPVAVVSLADQLKERRDAKRRGA